MRHLAAQEGCYEARRAAALSGVPLSTVYDWARKKVVVPSISPEQEKLWSYADLMALRIVSWLRHPKDTGLGPVRPSPMGEVRSTLAYLDSRGIDIWRSDQYSVMSPLLVDRAGEIWIRTEEGAIDYAGRATLDLEGSYLELLSPFTMPGNVEAPDLLRPRPSLRIIPLKVAGEPHIVDSRITSRTLAALRRRGFEPHAIAAMYEIDDQGVVDALDLERQLEVVGAAA